jgi:hypothetical protein
MRKNFEVPIEVPIIGSIIGFRMSVARLSRRRTTCLTGGEPAEYPLIEACLARPRPRPTLSAALAAGPRDSAAGASRSVPCPCPLLPRREVATAARLTGPPYGPVSIGRTCPARCAWITTLTGTNRAVVRFYRRPAHPACPALPPATRRKLLDGEPLSADSRAHRAARVAPDVIESPTRGSGIMRKAGTQRRCP